LAAIRQFSQAPIKYIVLTHFHPDHTGGAGFFVKQGATLISSPNLRQRLADNKTLSREGVPTVAINGPTTYYFNGEEIELTPMYPAHTDGDTVVYFRHHDVVMGGDIIRAGYPNGVKMASGSDDGGVIQAYGMMIGMGTPNTKYIPGHGPFFNRNDLTTYRDMLVVTRDRIEKLKAEGKSADDAIAAKPTADYDDLVLRKGFGYGDVASFYDDGTMVRMKDAAIYVKEVWDEVHVSPTPLVTQAH
jgi:glyoxylase-like metal-dependent hydrolase (beta-lactamase superfamily II)